jgi:hypothetical protein
METAVEHTLEPTSVPNGFREDAKGRLVRLSMIKEEHLLEDQLVNSVFERAEMVSELLRSCKKSWLEDAWALVELLADKYDSPRGGVRGNFTLMSFDGRRRMQIAVADRVEFGPQLQVAKDLIDSCLRRWSEGADAKLQTFVEEAFNVDKEGTLNVGRILGLRRFKIEDAEWSMAMTAISEAVRIVSTMHYVRIYRRNPTDGKYVQLSLDLASA